MVHDANKLATKCFSHTVGCGGPGTPSNGMTEITSDTFGSTVNHTCNEGYVLNGTNERECLANGSWSAPLPSCDSKSLYTMYSYTYCLIAKNFRNFPAHQPTLHVL